MLNKLALQNVLFLDIETVSQYESWNQVSKEEQDLYALKTKYQRNEDSSLEEFYNKAGIWAEFGKIICISVGYFIIKNSKSQLRVTSFYGDDEVILLKNFKKLLDKHFNLNKHLLCAHNGKEFDFPYIARRMVVHRIPLPDMLNLFGKKPWEVKHIDPLELWKFGDYKHYTSLKLLTHILGIPSPKQDIDGSEVANVYYKENNLKRIVEYCERDTVAVAQLMLRFCNKPLLDRTAIVKV